MIVTNEVEWARDAIERRDLGNKSFETLRRVAGYYLQEGLSPKDARQRLEEFLLSCDPKAVIGNWEKRMDDAMRAAQKYPLIVVDGVDITQKELDTINGVGAVQARRLAFTLLCFAKFFNKVKGKNDGWVNSPDTDVLRAANIDVSIAKQSAIFKSLKDAGLIKIPMRVDSISVQVLFVDNKGKSVWHVDDFRNLGYQYMYRYGSGAYCKCESCGIVFPLSRGRDARGRHKKYCPDCAVKIRLKQTVDSVMRHRAIKADEKM